METLTVTWMRLSFFVVRNLLLCTDAANYYTSAVFPPCGIPSRDFSLATGCGRNVQHFYQFPYLLFAVDLDINLVVSSILP